MRICGTFFVFCLFVSVVSVATRGFDRQKTPKTKPSLAAAIEIEISGAEKQFVDVVEAMPEDKFSYSPENSDLSGSAFKGVRSFALQARHVAADNFAIWAPLTGKPETRRRQCSQWPGRHEVKDRDSQVPKRLFRIQPQCGYGPYKREFSGLGGISRTQGYTYIACRPGIDSHQ